MTVQDALLSRIPAGALGGKNKTIRNALSASLELIGARGEASNRGDLSASGRAALVGKHVTTASGPALMRARRQVAYDARKIEKMRAAIHAKAIGEPHANDAEWRTYLRSLSANDRAQLILRNADARGAALRAPALSHVEGDMLDTAMAAAIRERCEKDGAHLAIAEKAQEIHQHTVRVLVDEIMATPMVVEANNAVRQFGTQIEMEQYLNKSVSEPTARQIAIEEAESDLIE